MNQLSSSETERNVLADYLENLAAQLRQGRVEVDGHIWQVPEKLLSEAHVKEKKGSIRYKLQWKWSTVEQYDKRSRESLEEWRGSMKTIKKRMSVLFRELKDSTAQGELPDKRTLDEFVDVVKAFSEVAEPEWGEAIQEFLDHLSMLMSAVEEGRNEAALHEIRDLGNRMSVCHRDFK